jgi:CBS domain-containing protein
MQDTVGLLMQPSPRVIDSAASLAELERAFIESGVRSFPVVERGKLVGIVSRSDVVRQLSVEQTLAENVSDAENEVSGFEDEQDEAEVADELVGDQVGQRLERLRVADVMIRNVHTVSADTPLSDAAKLLVSRRIHQAPVVDAGKVVGLLSALDFARPFADGRVRLEQ